MSKVVQLIIWGTIVGTIALLFASIDSSCYFFITTFTWSDFEERTASFVLGVVSALFAYGTYNVFMHALEAINNKWGDIMKKAYKQGQ